MELEKLTQKLKKRMGSDLPGSSAHSLLGVQINQPYNFDTSEKDATPSAVLILLHEINNEIHFILTERTQTVDSHKGQISLPGGAKEKGELLSQTAIRETQEEIGIDHSHINIVGKLSPLFVPVTGFMIYPFIGTIEYDFDLVLAKDEVESAFSVQLNELLNDAVQMQEKRELRGYEVDIPYFLLDEKKVWGATAMILSEFKEVVRELS